MLEGITGEMCPSQINASFQEKLGSFPSIAPPNPIRITLYHEDYKDIADGQLSKIQDSPKHVTQLVIIGHQEGLYPSHSITKGYHVKQ